MGSKKRKCCNTAAWIYVVSIPLLILLYNGETKQTRTISKAAEKLNLYGNITYDTLEQQTNESTLAGKLPAWQDRCRLNASGVTDNALLSFKPVMTQDDYDILMGLLRKLKQVSEENVLTYMLTGGSVLGTYRHAGFVPWDDDIDVWMDFQQAEKARLLLNNTADIILHQSAYTKNLWKMSNASRKGNIRHPNQDPRFPYIDIYFFTGNSTHIFDTETSLKERTTVLVDDIFPVRKALFEDEEFFVPNKMLTYLEEMYGRSSFENCTSHDFTHLFYVEINNTVSVPCEDLFSFYPFIKRSYINNTLIETLAFMNETVRKTVTYLGSSNEQIAHEIPPHYHL